MGRATQAVRQRFAWLAGAAAFAVALDASAANAVGDPHRGGVARAPSARTFPIVFAVDTRLGLPVERRDPNAFPTLEEPDLLLAGRRHAAALVSEANRLLGAQLGGSFALAEVRLWPVAGDSLEARLDDLRTKVQAPGFIVAGLTTPIRGGEAIGLASYREALVVVAAPWGRFQGGRLFAHELAHLFGAVHLSAGSGLLDAADPGQALDPLNGRLVALHRERRFGRRLFPLPPEALEPARRAYREAVTGAPEAEAHLSQISLELGDPAGALEAADHVLQRDPGEDEARVARGIALRQLGRSTEAVQEYQRVLERRPSHALAHYNLAIALDHLGQSERALAAYERAIELDPGSASAFSNLARLLAQRGAVDRALAAARRALELAPDHTGARVNLAMALLAAGDSVSAETQARQAVAEKPDLAAAHEVLGAAMLSGGRPEVAAESFQRASQLQPGEPRFLQQEALALRGLARWCRDTHDLDGAQAALERATSLVPSDAEAWSERADLAFERGQQGEALAAYARLLALRPEDAAAHNNLAVLLFRSGDVAGARQHVEKARRLGLAVHPAFLKALAEAERP